jgi:hypothetical protein
MRSSSPRAVRPLTFALILASLSALALSGCGDRQAAEQAYRLALQRAALMNSAVHLHAATSPSAGHLFSVRRLGNLHRVITPDGKTLARASLRRSQQAVSAQDPQGHAVGKTQVFAHAIALLDPTSAPLLTLRVEPDGLQLTLLDADGAPLHRLAFNPDGDVIAYPVCPPPSADLDPCDDTPFTVSPGPATSRRRSPTLTLPPFPPSGLADEAPTALERRVILEPNSGFQPLGFALLNLPRLPLSRLLPLALHVDRLGLPPPPPLPPKAT